MVIQPFAEIDIAPLIAGLPKADLHLHQEAPPRLQRIAALRQGQPPYDWLNWARRVFEETPPGMARLLGVYQPDAGMAADWWPEGDADSFIARVADVLDEAASNGAFLAEVRFGADQHFMSLFREAERQVRARYPNFCAEAICLLNLGNDPDRLREAERRLMDCVSDAREGLAGVDLLIGPYDTEADPSLWATAYRWAERAAGAGLGITVHSGEFSTANLAAALRVPGLKRLGHAVHAASDPRMLDLLQQSGVTVECSLTCNVVLGAVPSFESHPIRQFVAHRIPATLSTDLPVHVCTSISREYAIGAALGFSPSELLQFTRNAILASFTSPERRNLLLDELQRWEAEASRSGIL